MIKVDKTNEFWHIVPEFGKIYDKIETNWNGQYRFDYLRKGDYTIFVYADSTDILNISYDYPVFQHISVEANNSTYTLSDFIINK